MWEERLQPESFRLKARFQEEDVGGEALAGVLPPEGSIQEEDVGGEALAGVPPPEGSIPGRRF